MRKRLIIFFIITTLLILFHGLYRIYEFFYPSYFSQTDYTQISFLGNKVPSKLEVLFSGFKDLQLLIASSLVSFVIICSFEFIKRKQSF